MRHSESGAFAFRETERLVVLLETTQVLGSPLA